jgi:ketosteroid isomerase-like protein
VPGHLLERIREGYEAWNRGDLDHTLAVLSPDVEWLTSASFPGVQPVYCGHDGFREFWKHLHEPWESIHVEIESYERDGEVATLMIRFHGISKGSGVPVDLPWFQALVIEDDLITRSALARTIGDALEALDISDRWPEF